MRGSVQIGPYTSLAFRGNNKLIKYLTKPKQFKQKTNLGEL